MRELAIACLLTVVRLAYAGEPSGYQCGDGKTIVGKGCDCPANKIAVRDDENTAVCIPRPAPVVQAAKQQPKPTTAQQAFEQADLAFKAFQSIPELRFESVDRIRKELETLKKKAAKLEDDYRVVGSFKDLSWSLAALERSGEIHELIFNRIVSAPIPREIAKADEKYPDAGILAGYQESLEKLAKPYLDEAIDAWKRVVETARKNGIWNEYVSRAQNRLAIELPDQFTRYREPRLPASTTRDPADAGRWNDVAIMFLKAHAFADAKEAADRSLAKTPSLHKARINLASALRGLEKWDDAEAQLKQAIAADKTLADAYYNLVALMLDAPAKPGVDALTRWNQARAYLAEFRAQGGKGEDTLARDVDKAIKLEERRRKKAALDEQRRQQAPQPKP